MLNQILYSLINPISSHIQNENSNYGNPTKKTEPESTLRDEGSFFHILIELPEIAEEKIRIDLENQSHSISILASNGVTTFKKVIFIPCTVRLRKKWFSNQVLEIILEKTPPDITR